MKMQRLDYFNFINFYNDYTKDYSFSINYELINKTITKATIYFLPLIKQYITSKDLLETYLKCFPIESTSIKKMIKSFINNFSVEELFLLSENYLLKDNLSNIKSYDLVFMAKSIEKLINYYLSYRNLKNNNSLILDEEMIEYANYDTEKSVTDEKGNVFPIYIPFVESRLQIFDKRYDYYTNSWYCNIINKLKNKIIKDYLCKNNMTVDAVNEIIIGYDDYDKNNWICYIDYVLDDSKHFIIHKYANYYIYKDNIKIYKSNPLSKMPNQYDIDKLASLLKNRKLKYEITSDLRLLLIKC